MEWNHKCNFGRGNPGERSCEVTRNLDQWFRQRCRFKKKLTDGAQQMKTNQNSEEKLLSPLSVMLSPKPMDEIKQSLVCELLTWMP